MDLNPSPVFKGLAFSFWILCNGAIAEDRIRQYFVKAGRLDKLAAKALEDLQEGRCTDLAARF